MKTPERAIILCAGFGSRMMPLSVKTPKPMLPIWGHPAVEHILKMLERWGVKEVLINIHHAPQPLLHYLTRTYKGSLRINISFEHTILGSGGAISKAEWFLNNEPFWLINGDIAVDVNPTPFLNAFQKMKPSAVLWVSKDAGPRTVEVKKNIVQTFRTLTPGANGTYTFCGLHLISPSAISAISNERFSSIIDAYTTLIKHGHNIAGISVSRNFWADIGTVDGYINAHRNILASYNNKQPGGGLIDSTQLTRMRQAKKNGKIKGFISIGKNVDIAPNANICDSVIWNDVKVMQNANIKNTIVADNTLVRGKTERMVLPLSEIDDPALVAAVKTIDLFTSKTTVEAMSLRGSARIFTRIRSASKSVIAIRYSLERAENALYVSNARFLQRLGVPVPKILLNKPSEHLLLMQDVGCASLLEATSKKSTKSIIGTYKKVIDAIMPMHNNGVKAAKKKKLDLAPPFSKDMYNWEHDLFVEHFLRNTLSAPVEITQQTRRSLDCIASHLLAEPECLIHRDLQSTNIIFHKKSPVFIDFQGMRLGSAAYDIASLLCDPYVSLPLSAQLELLQYWLSVSSGTISPQRDVFWYAAIQRLIQAIGAYARLSSAPNTHSFGVYIKPGLKMLDRALDHVHDNRELKKTVNWCINRLTVDAQISNKCGH